MPEPIPTLVAAHLSFYSHFNQLKMRKRFFLMIAVVALSLSGCVTLNTKDWNFSWKQSFHDSPKPRLKLKGYYRMISEAEKCDVDINLMYDPCLILYETGFCVFPGLPEDWAEYKWMTTSKSFYKSAGLANWGRYIVKEDSIFIQSFNLSGSWPPRVMVRGIRGIFANDSTLLFYAGFENYVNKSRLHRKDYYKQNCQTPAVYHFVRRDSVLSGNNWIEKRGW